MYATGRQFRCYADCYALVFFCMQNEYEKSELGDELFVTLFDFRKDLKGFKVYPLKVYPHIWTKH